MNRPVILGVGTVALDTVESPAGSVRDVPGGSALYFAAAASLLGPVAVVGVTGADFPVEPLDRLAARGVDVSGIVRLPEPTFRWRARYDASGRREVVSVHRGSVVRTAPEVPDRLRDPSLLFLGSTDPAVQRRVLEQAGSPARVILDTMPHWIRDGRPELEALLPRVDVVLVTEEELALLGGEAEEAAAGLVRGMGPAWVVLKRGDRGATAFGPSARVDVGAVRVGAVVDPTGAGDAFAGGMASSLRSCGGITPRDMLRALTQGALMGACAVSAFSFEALMRSDPERGA